MALAIARHFRPRRAVPRRTTWETRVDPTWIESLLTESVRLNQTGRSFTRATSAWDPVHNCILAPGQPRQVYARYRDRVSIPLDLPEGARTNLLAAGSSEFQSGWSFSHASLLAASWTAPDGESAPMLAEDSTASTTHEVFQSIAITTTLPYTISVIAKANTRSVIILQFGSTTFSTTPTAWFNLSAGVVSKTSGSPTSTSITPVPGQPGVYRCTMTATSTATGSDNAFVYLDISPTGSGVYSGQGSTFGAFVWGASLEQAAFPSSYISNRNLILHSQDTTGWAGTHVAGTGNYAAGPNGDTTATRLVYAGGSGSRSSYWSKNSVSLPATANLTFTVSIWVKSTSGANQIFCLDNAQGGVADHFSANFIATNQWQRFTWTVTNGASAGTLQGIAVCAGSADGAFDLVVYGAQVEYGSVATAYWGTNATVGGRDAEVLESTIALGVNGTVHAICIPQGWSGVAVASSTNVMRDASNNSLVMNASGTGNNFNVFRYDAGGTEGPSDATPGFTNGVMTQFSICWDSVSVIAHANGAVTGTTDTTLTPPYVAVAAVYIGCQNTTGKEFNGFIAAITEPRKWTELEHKLVGQYANLVLGQA